MHIRARQAEMAKLQERMFDIIDPETGFELLDATAKIRSKEFGSYGGGEDWRENIPFVFFDPGTVSGLSPTRVAFWTKRSGRLVVVDVQDRKVTMNRWCKHSVDEPEFDCRFARYFNGDKEREIAVKNFVIAALNLRLMWGREENPVTEFVSNLPMRIERPLFITTEDDVILEDRAPKRPPG